MSQIDRDASERRLVEESAAAAESLKHQATQLAQTVAQFRLDSSQVAAAPTPAAAAPRVKPRSVPAPQRVSAAPAGKGDGEWAAF